MIHRPRPASFFTAITLAALLSVFTARADPNRFRTGTRWNISSDWDTFNLPTTAEALLFDHTYLSVIPTTTLGNSFTVQTLGFDTGSDFFSIEANPTATTPRTLSLTGGGFNAVGGTASLAMSANTTGTIGVGANPDHGKVTVDFGTAASVDVRNAQANLIFGSNSALLLGAGLRKEGAGTMTINGSASFGTPGVAGYVTVNDGTLNLNGTGQFGSVTLSNDAILAVQNPNTTFAPGSTLDTGSGILDFQTTGTASFASLNGGGIIRASTEQFTLEVGSDGSSNIYGGSLTGAGLSVRKTGAGTLNLGGLNTYSGTTYLSGGTVYLTAPNSFGSTDPYVSGLIRFEGGTLRYSIVNRTDYSARFASGGAVSIDTNGEAVTFATGLSGGGGSLAKTGGGTLTLAGASSYTGPTTISAGTLALQNSGALGQSSGATVAGGAALQLSGGISTTSAVPLTLQGAGVAANPNGALENVSGANTYTGAITLGAAATIGSSAGTLNLTSTITGSGFDLTLAGAGDGNVGGAIALGGATLTKAGAGTWTIAGPNTFTGGIAINGGTLGLGHAGALGSAGTITFGGGILRFGPANTTDYSSRFSTAPNQQYKIDVDTNRFVSIGTALTSAGGSLTKLGGGMLNLGDATYTGPTVVSGGTLSIYSSLYSPAASFTVDGDATNPPQAQSLFTGTITVDSITLGNLNVGHRSGNFVQGGGSVTLNSNNIGLYVAGGSYQIAGTATLYAKAAVPVFGKFIQTGGSVTADGYLLCGGAYSMSGTNSILSVPQLNLYGGGHFESDGSVTRDGVFTQNDGAVTVTRNATGGTFDPSLNQTLSITQGGLYVLNGGSLTTTYSVVGGASFFFIEPSSFTQRGGTHLTTSLNLSISSSGGTYHLDGGTLRPGLVSGISRDGSHGNSTFNFNGGTLQAAQSTATFFQDLTTANVRDFGAVIDTNGFNVTIAQNLTHSNIANDRAIDGGLTKVGAGTLTLTGANAFTGPVTIQAGTLAVASEAKLGAGNSVTVLGGQLLFTGNATLSRTYNLGVTALAPGSNTLTFAGATVNGGTLGAGASVLADGATLNGTRTTNGSVLSQSGGTVSWNQMTLGGNSTFTQAAGATFHSTGELVTTPNSTMSINGAFTVLGGSISGAVTVQNGGQLNQSGPDPLYLDGSRSATINAGGQLNAAPGSALELGGLLVNNGTQTGALNVNLGGVAKGSGAFGTVQVFDGGRFSPGNSPGTAVLGSATFGAGSHYDFEINSAHATPGNGADFLSVGGTLTLAAGTTQGTRFTIDLVTLDASNHPAPLADFDASQPYHFTLATAAGGIAGFDPATVGVGTTGFLNDLQGGFFSVVAEGNDLRLDFTPVPEPEVSGLLVASIGLGAGLLRMRRRRSEPC